MPELTHFQTMAGALPTGDALAEAVRELRQPQLIRERCGNLTEWVTSGESPHFTIERGRLREVARRASLIARERYPGPQVPGHSVWRLIGTGRLAQLDARLAGLAPADRARAMIDLAVVASLLDADAGTDWGYTEPGGGRRLTRSEGLAVAAFYAFLGGRFSTDPRQPLRVDAQALQRLDAPTLSALFQSSPDRALAGLDGRLQLLQRLGRALAKRPDVFGRDGRPGRLLDLLSVALVAGTGGAVHRMPLKRLGAPHILRTLLKAFAGVLPNGPVLGGKPLGDVWPHPQAGGNGPSAGRVPFHLQLQWTTLSLVEPFEAAGLAIDGLDELTGLPDLRHGSLFLDAGVIVPRRPGWNQQIYTPADPWVVEWRAMTVTLFDEVARLVRAELGQPSLSLAAVMHGGTWPAGQQLAAELRPGGPPPLRLAGNGTLL